MGFLRRLRGQSNEPVIEISIGPAAPTSGKAADLGDLRADLPPDALVLKSGAGGLMVVGERFYRDAIEGVTGGRRTESIKATFWGTLVPERDNPHDPKAVGVYVLGTKVGHLPKEDARRYRALLEKIAASGRTAYCRTDIRGGWNAAAGEPAEHRISVYVAEPEALRDQLA